MITTDGDEGNAAYVFMTVEVPRATVIHANLDGTLANNGVAETIDLFTYEVNTGWVLLGNLTQYTSDSVIYTYAYATATNYDGNGIVTAATCTALEVGESATLFDEVTFANVIEDQGLEDTDLEIVINSYAIQTDDLTISGSGITDAYSVLEVIYNQLDD